MTDKQQKPYGLWDSPITALSVSQGCLLYTSPSPRDRG